MAHPAEMWLKNLKTRGVAAIRRRLPDGSWEVKTPHGYFPCDENGELIEAQEDSESLGGEDPL